MESFVRGVVIACERMTGWILGLCMLGWVAYALTSFPHAALHAPPRALSTSVDPLAGNAPPPYTPGDVGAATVNALAAIGRTEGVNTELDGSATAVDLLDDPVFSNELDAAALSATRTYTIKLVTALSGTDAACVRLGPATDGGPPPDNPDNAPALSCPGRASTGANGGCYLTSAGESCTFTVRPKTSGCVSFTTCHLPLWAVSTTTAVVSVGVAW